MFRTLVGFVYSEKYPRPELPWPTNLFVARRTLEEQVIVDACVQTTTHAHAVGPTHPDPANPPYHPSGGSVDRQARTRTPAHPFSNQIQYNTTNKEKAKKNATPRRPLREREKKGTSEYCRWIRLQPPARYFCGNNPGRVARSATRPSSPPLYKVRPNSASLLQNTSLFCTPWPRSLPPRSALRTCVRVYA
jgi:hypothetical protein